MTSILFVISVPQPIQMQLSKKIKSFFFNILLNFWNLHQILNILEHKMTFVAYVFSELHTMEIIVRQMSK